MSEQTSFARVSGYVEQNDVHSPQTTVREALEFSAQLRFAQGVPADTIQAFVDEVMGLVELTVLQSVLVSGLLHGLFTNLVRTPVQSWHMQGGLSGLCSEPMVVEYQLHFQKGPGYQMLADSQHTSH